MESVVQYTKMVVIFIDVLGSKEMTEFNQKHEIHKLFHNSVRESQNRQGSEHLSHVAYNRKLFSFSDCAYITYFYKDGVAEDRKDDRSLLQVALYNTSILITKIASHGYLVRGGVSFGDAFVDDDGCFGPAVEEAYLLESKHAIYPRVLLSQEAGRLQYDYETEIQSSPGMADFNKMVRDRVSRIVNYDSDNFYLNVFYHLEMEGSLNYEGNELTLDGVKSLLNKKIQTDLGRYQNDQNITNKLKWFKDYISKLKCCLKKGQYWGCKSDCVNTYF
jgi:hypothetical protein